MCSCDYFGLTNYRCPGREKDEFDQATRLLAGKFVLSNKVVSESVVYELPLTLRAKNFRWRTR